MEVAGGCALKATKAYIAGLGTTGVLLASAVGLLVLVSALVGFDRWPGGALGDRVERVELRPGEEAIPVEDVLPAGAPLPADAGTIALAPLPGAGPAAGAVPGPGTGGVPPVLGDRDAGGAPGAAPGGGTAPAAPVEEVTSRPISEAPDRARSLLADTTEGVTRDAGRTIGSLSPETGSLVDAMGRDVADQLRALPVPFSASKP